MLARYTLLLSLSMPVLVACGDDSAAGGGGASAGVDCEALDPLDECRAEASCQSVESAQDCAGNTGNSGCFFASCEDCPAGRVCQTIIGGDGADGCVEAARCIIGD